jgi:hypothetical protein
MAILRTNTGAALIYAYSPFFSGLRAMQAVQSNSGQLESACRIGC